MIKTRTRSGDWLVLDSGVYSHLTSVPTWERSVMAAVLAEPWAVASHQSAAVLHGLLDFRPGRPVVTIRPGANARGQLAVAHRGIDVHTTVVQQIPSVTLDQVFVDLSQVSSERRVRAALAHQVDQSPRLLDAVRDRYCELAPRGGRNLGRLRAVLERFGAGEPPDESQLERLMRTVFTAPGVPPIRWQAPFPGRSAGLQRVDGLIDAWLVVLEGDGRTWHTRVDDFEHDRRRDSEAAAAGLLTLRFTWHQLVSEPDWALRVLLDVGSHRTSA